MFVHKLAATVRNIVPESLVRPIRKIGTAFLTPFEWSYHTGHFRSSLKGMAIDRGGEPLVWYTYAAIEFLRYKDFSNKHVLEFGAGQSTLWWASHAANVTSYENDRAWFERLRPKLPANVSLRFIEGLAPSIGEFADASRFDVIVIDGLGRLECAEITPDLLKDDGLIIFDNSEGTWGGDADQTYPIIDLFRDKGFLRIDFYGWCPGGIAPSCTSIFFKPDCFLFAAADHPIRRIQ